MRASPRSFELQPVLSLGCPVIARLELAEGSEIVYSPEVGRPDRVTVEPLMGMLTAVFRGFEPQTLLYEITNLGLQSNNYSITPGTLGSAGSAMIFISGESAAELSIETLVNQQALTFGGASLLPDFQRMLSALVTIELCPPFHFSGCSSLRTAESEGYGLFLAFE